MAVGGREGERLEDQKESWNTSSPGGTKRCQTVGTLFVAKYPPLIKQNPEKHANELCKTKMYRLWYCVLSHCLAIDAASLWDESKSIS